MTIPEVPQQIPGQSNIVIPRIANPYLSIWWSTQTVTNVPENVMGWLVAQGYEITGVTQDKTTVPPTNYFALTREGMKPQDVLLSLCNSYTIAANDALTANQIRYNEILNNWTDLIDTSHDQFNAQTTEQNAQAGVFLTDLDNYMDAIETLIADNQSQLVADAAEAKTSLLVMDSRLSELESNAATSAVTINNLLIDQEANLQAYVTAYDARLTELQQNVTSHLASILNDVSGLGSILQSHIADYRQQFDLLVANYNLYVADIDALLANVSSNVTEYVAIVDSILTALDSDYESVDTDLGDIRTSAGSLVDDHVIDYQETLDLLISDYSAQSNATRAIINFLYPDYAAHETESTEGTDSLRNNYIFHEDASSGLLSGLGATERARINEEFAAKLSTQLQMLVSNGLYTSIIAADITERNHRDRDEQIQLLNDRLNREKFENQHKLYEQQRVMVSQVMDNQHRLYEQRRAVRTQLIEAEQRLYEQQLGMRTRTLDGKSHLHSVQQEVLRYQASLISGVYALLQETRNRVLSGKQAIFAAKDASERLKIDAQSRLYAQLQDMRQKTIDSLDRIYQLRDLYAKWDNAETHKTYEQLQQVKQQFVEAVERQHTAKQAVTRAEMAQRDTLLQQLQASLTGLLSGKERFSSLLMQNANTMAEHKHKAILERMNTATQRLDGWKSVAAENRALMAYQLDERNKLLIGLYSFVERREDISPEWKDMSTMIASLGDSGGGWMTP